MKKKNNWIKYASMGTEFLVAIGLSVWIGLWADTRFDTKPLWLVVLPVLAIVAVLYRIIRSLGDDSRRDKS